MQARAKQLGSRQFSSDRAQSEIIPQDGREPRVTNDLTQVQLRQEVADTSVPHTTSGASEAVLAARQVQLGTVDTVFRDLETSPAAHFAS